MTPSKTTLKWIAIAQNDLRDAEAQMNSTQVLIVGAGPTGLAAAATLAKLGIKVRIIDKGSTRSDKSKALGVQAGTLECLEKAIDQNIVQRMIERCLLPRKRLPATACS